MPTLDEIVAAAPDPRDPAASQPTALDRAVAAAPPKRQTISDYARQLQRGATSAFQTAPAQVASMLGAPRTAVDEAQAAEKSITERLSPQARFITETPVYDVQQGWHPAAGQAILSAAVESAPSLVQSYIAGRPLFDVLGRAGVGQRVAGAAQRAGIPKRAAGVIGRAAEATPFAMVEGAQAGAMAAAQQGQQARGLDETKLLAAPGFERALAGTDPALPQAERVAAAREALAQQVERQALAMTGASTGAIGALTSGGVIGQFARRLAGRTGIDAAKDTALRALARGAGAETLQEAPQSAAEQAIGNLITQRLVDSGQEIDEGVLNAAITGGAAGGLLGGLGGGAGYLARPRQRDELVDESAGPQRQPGSAVVEPPAPPVDPGAGPMSKAVVVGQTEGAIPTNAIGGPVDAPPEQPAGPSPEEVAQQQAHQQQREDSERTKQWDAAEKQALALNERIAKAHEQARKAAENGDEEGVERAKAMAEAMRDRLAQVQDRMRRMREEDATQPGTDDAAIGPSRSAAVPRSDMGADVPGAGAELAARHGAAGDAQPDGGRGVRVPAEPSSALARLEGGAAAARDGEGAGAVGGLSVSFGGKSYPVDSLEDAAAKWSQFRDTSGAGASEVGNGVSVVDAAGNEVGRVSYNGRIWRDGAASAPQASRSDVRTEVDDWLQGMTPMARADAMRAAGVESAATESDLAKLRDVMRADLADAQRQFDAQQAATPLNAGATPLTAPGATAVDAAAAQSPSSPSNGLPEPSKAQKEAGNYPKPPVQISGLTIRVENEAGTRRAPEYPTMKAHYGYFQGTKASDEEGVDVFVKPGTSDAYDGPVFVIDGLKRDGSYDEAKVMLGWEKKAGALASYRGSYEKGWKVGQVTQMTMAEFKAWLKDGDTTKPLAAQPAPKRSREEVSRERKRAYREANPFRAFLAEHGVATADRSDVGGERNRPVMVPYHGPLFRKTGLRLDELARRAVEAGFLTQADIDSDLDNGGVNKLSDMIRRMLAGERILPVTAAESEQEAQWRAQMDARYEAMQEAEDAIVEQASDDEINALLQLASDEDAEASNEEIDYIAGQERLGGETQEGAAGDAPRGDSRGGAEARAESPGEVDDDLSDIPFDLERQSDADVRQQEAQRRKDEAKAEREAAEQAKRDAAPPPEDFTLAGSDRPADQAAARGQQELAPAARTPEQIIDEYRKEYAKFSNLRPGLTLEQWRAAHDDIRAAENAAAQALVDIAERDGLSMKSAHNDNTLMLTPDPTSGGRTWRVTNFLPDGTPAGHMEYNSALEAAKSLLHDARGTKTDDRYSPPRQRVPSDGMPEGADEAVRKHGLEGERVGWTRGKGLNANRWAASVGNMQGNYRDTADEAVASLREFLDAARRREEGDARQRQAAQAAADKIKRGEQPTDAEWAAIFPGWREGHRYVRQPAASWFLTEFLGVPKHNIRANIGAAAGTLTSDSGAEYPIVYPKKLRDVFGRRDGQPIGRDGLTDAERASNRLDGIASELSGVIQEEASQQDFVPSEIPTVIEQWAKDNEVDAGDLRTRVLDRLRKRLSEGRMRQVERSLSGEKPSVAANRKPGIADFGEKIEGARKDVWASFRDKMQQAGTVDIAAEPLSKSWPAPDYQALLDEGADPWAIAFMHAARDAIPTKPQKKWKVRAWVDSVRLLRDVSMGLADGSIDRARAQALLAEAEKTSRGMSDIAGRIELYQLVGHSKSLAGVRLSRGEYSLYNGVEHKPPKVIWTVEKQAAATAFSNWPRQLASGDTKERALANFKEKFDALEIGKPAAKDTTFEVYSKRGENGYWVGKKVGRNPILLEGPFGTLKEARTYKDTHNAELTAKLEKSKEIPSERRDTNEPRVGEDMRGGADVTPEMFQETFSFKGVQFGNYVEQSRRQKDLNEAYDALMDMAAVLGVPPKALSLNGELGLAFGARGKGGKGAAAAHYERGHVVINLTKREGAGSLGHEWWHALDNYFARMRGLASDDMTESSDVGTASHTGKFVHRGDVRREMVAAFGEVLRAIRSTAIKARSSKLDAKRTKAYWTTSAEMSARAYESYLISKLQDQGASNDYLANIVDEATWAAAEKLGFELEESYPYPTAGEVPAIRAAFDHFFQTVQTRETDRGLAIFEPTAQYRVDEPQGTQTDLFGVPGEPGENRRTRPDRTRVRGNVQPAAALSDTEAPAGEYFLRTILGTETSRQLGASVIQTHADAARATKYLYRNAVERFDGIVTDKDGKPLAVVGGFKGALSQASVYPATLIGEAVRIPGAARIWFSHNHPSGTAELSGADRTLHRALNSVFRGSGIEPMGLLAVAGDSYAFEGTSPSGLTGDVQNNLPIYGKDERVEVPVIERMIAPDGVAGRQIDSPAAAKTIGEIFYNRTKEPGLLLVSAQNRVVAWVPLSSNMLGKLRDTGGLQSLYRAVSESTVGGALIVHGGELSALPDLNGVSVVDNIGAALKQVDVTPLDAINVVTGHSQAEHGASLASGPVFSRGTGAGMHVAEVTAIVDAARKAWVNAPPIVVVESLEDSRVPQAVRDADTRSDRGAAEGVFHDGTVYLVAGNLATEADVVRVLMHESLGHHGLRGVFGDSLNAVLDKVVQLRRADVVAKMRQYRLQNTVDGRRTAAEEVLASLAQTEPQLPLVRAAIAAIRSWLRRVFPNLRLSNDEIARDYLIPARAWVMRGAQAASVAGVVASFSRGPQHRGTEAEARAQGFTMKAYRGVSAAAPFNDSGTTWATTNREVAESYAEEVMGYDDPAVLEVMIRPDGLVRHDASRLTDAQRAELGADGFGNPQAPGIYDRSDDHPLGGSRRNVTVIHAPADAVFVIDNIGTFDHTNPDIRSPRRQDVTPLGFYSELSRKVEAGPGRADAANWKSFLRSQKGIKPDEIEWSGIEDWLGMQSGKVTKEAVLAYLANNGVKVEEVVLGKDVVPPGAEPELTADQIEIYEDAEDAEFWTADAPAGNRLIGKKHYPTKEAAREFALRYFNGQIKERNRERAASAGTTPKFADHRVPGAAENYRELLLTLPEPPKKTVFTLYEGGNYFGQYATRKEAEAAKASERRPTAMVTEIRAPEDGSVFRSGHWDQPNVLAHVRFDERHDADGKRVLFINELQSDWAAANRKALGEITKTESVRELADDIFGGKMSSMMALEQMDGGVLSALKHDQVRRAVIASLPVDVVNNLAALQLSPEQIFSDTNVLVLRLPANHLRSVADGLLGAARSVGARLRAELLSSRDAGRDGDLLPALKASDLDTREVVGLLAPERLYHLGLPGSASSRDVAGPGAVGAIGPGDVARGPTELDSTVSASGRGDGRAVAGQRAESSGRGVAGFNAKNRPASLAGLLNWHSRILRETGHSQRARYVPGPFVGQTESYVALTLKRIIRYAADNGFDRVAIVNGEQAADMFDLSHHIERLYYTKNNDGTYTLSAESGYGEVFRERQRFPEVALEDVVGKEIAQRIIDGRGSLDEDSGSRVLEGLDLKVGGEGMRAFYDKIVPVVLKDVLKKVGGRLTTVKLGEVAKGNVYDGNRQVATNVTREQYDSEWGDGYRFVQMNDPAAGMEQLGFDITPAMREAAMAGQPMFSLQEQAPAGTMGQRASDVLRGLTVRDVMHRFGNRLRDLRGVSLQALGRRQIVDIYGDMLPQLRDYDDIAQQMEAEKNEGAAEADGLADRWGKLRNERALAELMHDATLARVDPARDDAGSQLHPEYPALRRRWEALGEQAQAVYLEARDAYRAHYEKVKNEIRLRIRRSIPDSPMRAAMLEEMEATLFADWEGVYFPLARFGDYVVVARDAGGNTVAVSRAESLNEAETMRARMMRTLPASRGYSVGKIIKSREFNAARDGVGRSFLHKLYGVLDEQGALGAELQDSINQLYLSSLPDLSWTKHGIHRKGTPGFSQDARRAFAQNMFHGARYLAKLRHSDLLADSLMAMQEHVDAQAAIEDYDSVAGQQVVDEMTKRHDLFLNPKINPWATAATSAGFVWYLGLSPASAVVNLSQTPLVAYPLMGAKWGFRKAASALERASRETMAAGNDLSKRLKGAELDAFERAVKDGTIDITQAHDLAGIAQGEDQGVVWRMRPIMKAASFLFHHAEKFNRQATFLAAYRMAKDANPAITEDEAYRQAKDITYRAHFDYAAGNKPRVMQGNIARVVLLFKQFAQNMVYTLARQGVLAAKGDREAAKAFGALLTSHALAAGIFGLPLVNVLLEAASMLGSTDDEPWDAEGALRNYMAEAFGPTGGAAIAHGLSRLTPWDISGRVGLDNLIFPDIREGLEGDSLAGALAVGGLGPVYGMLIGGPLKGLSLIGEGHWLRGLEAMLPSVLRSGLKSMRYAGEGATTRDGKTIVEDVGAAEWLGQLAGFSPSRVRDASKAREIVFDLDRRLRGRRAQLMRDFGDAVMHKDHDAMGRYLGQVQAFNQANPERAITIESIRRSVIERQRRAAEAEMGIFLPRKSRGLLEQGGFADVR